MRGALCGCVGNHGLGKLRSFFTEKVQHSGPADTGPLASVSEEAINKLIDRLQEAFAKRHDERAKDLGAPKIRAEAEALDALRKRVLAEHHDLTLTKLYNVLEALREGRALTEAERDIHDRGLVTLIRQHHDAIDALVAEAYGWPADLSDEEILTRLVALNKQRAAEEAMGLIRWLRPEYQAPNYPTPVTQSLDLDEAAAALPDNVITWPASLPEQVSAVQSILAASSGPLAPQDIARAFKGKRAATVRPVLDALTGIGMARRLKDGRYAA